MVSGCVQNTHTKQVVTGVVVKHHQQQQQQQQSSACELKEMFKSNHITNETVFLMSNFSFGCYFIKRTGTATSRTKTQ